MKVRLPAEFFLGISGNERVIHRAKGMLKVFEQPRLGLSGDESL